MTMADEEFQAEQDEDFEYPVVMPNSKWLAVLDLVSEVMRNAFNQRENPAVFATEDEFVEAMSSMRYIVGAVFSAHLEASQAYHEQRDDLKVPESGFIPTTAFYSRTCLDCGHTAEHHRFNERRSRWECWKDGFDKDTDCPCENATIGSPFWKSQLRLGEKR